MITVKLSKYIEIDHTRISDAGRMLEMHEELAQQGYSVQHRMGTFSLFVEIELSRDVTWLALKYPDLIVEEIDKC